MTKKFKIFLSIEKRIILYLADFNYLKDKFEVIEAITQPGLAEALDVRLEHISRASKKLIENDYMFVRSSFIKSLNRQKKAYFLTKKGLKINKEILQYLNNQTVLVLTLKNELREIKYNQIKNYLKTEYKPLDIYHNALSSKNRIINLKKL